MASKKVQIQIDTKANTAGAQQAEQSLKKLDETASKASNTVNTTTASSSKLGSAMGQAGFQIQDFAVQVGGGTSALTAFSQQAPQLLGIFGPTGAIAGALVAVGAVAAKVFMTMGDDAKSSAEKAESLAQMIDKIKENAANLQAEDVDFGSEAITKSIELAEILRDGMEAVAAAERNYSEQALVNAEKLRLVQVGIKELKGEQIDQSDEAAKKEQFQISQIEARKQSEIELQQARLQALEQDKAVAQETIDSRKVALDQARQLLQTLQQQVEAQKAQKAELEKTAQGIQVGFNPNPVMSPKAVQAKETLASTPFDAQISALEARIEQLGKDTEGRNSQLQRSLQAAIDNFNKIDATIPKLAQEVEIQTQAIVQAADTEAITATFKNRVEEAKANAQAVNAEIANFVPVNEIQAQALSEIKVATADLKITADETGNVSRNLQLIRDSLTQGQNLNLNTTNAILKSLDNYNLRLKELEKKAQTLPAGKIN